jgi:hypothetical protein
MRKQDADAHNTLVDGNTAAAVIASAFFCRDQELDNPTQKEILSLYRTCPSSRLMILLIVGCLMLAAGAARAQRPGQVSTSGRTFADPKSPGQSLIADLVAQGVTGCKGYASEPGVMAMAHADILFDRYSAGFNLAESFYSATWLIRCKEIVIGDPICAPYGSAPPDLIAPH